MEGVNHIQYSIIPRNRKEGVNTVFLLDQWLEFLLTHWVYLYNWYLYTWKGQYWKPTHGLSTRILAKFLWQWKQKLFSQFQLQTKTNFAYVSTRFSSLAQGWMSKPTERLFASFLWHVWIRKRSSSHCHEYIEYLVSTMCHDTETVL